MTTILVTTSTLASTIKLHPGMGYNPVLIQMDMPKDCASFSGVCQWFVAL